MDVPIYLDHNATTPCHPEVVSTMLPYFTDTFGNPSSEHHSYGWLTRDVIQMASEEIAQTLKIATKEIIYTSGATESINMVLKGVYAMLKTKGNHIITCKTEHKAVLDTCKFLEKEGAIVTYLDVLPDGRIDLDQLSQSLNSKTILVAIMYANNETGIIQPIEAIAQLVQEQECLFFSDATQALGKIALDDFFEHVDFACFSGHKIYGPKGIGFTYIKEKYHSLFPSFIQGGGQQRGMRGGTYNTPGIIGMAKAITLANEELPHINRKIQELRDRLEKELLAISHTFSNSTTPFRLPGTINLSFAYVDGENLLRALGTRIAVSNGSACNSAAVEPSHVLLAMGIDRSLAYASLRIGIGRTTTTEEIDLALALITKEVSKLREANILWEMRAEN